MSPCVASFIRLLLPKCTDVALSMLPHAAPAADGRGVHAVQPHQPAARRRLPVGAAHGGGGCCHDRRHARRCNLTLNPFNGCCQRVGWAAAAGFAGSATSKYSGGTWGAAAHDARCLPGGWAMLACKTRSLSVRKSQVCGNGRVMKGFRISANAGTFVVQAGLQATRPCAAP